MTFFSNNTDFQKYCNVNTGFELTNVENDFTAAFNKFVLPYLTTAQYNASVALPNNTTHAAIVVGEHRGTRNTSKIIHHNSTLVQLLKMPPFFSWGAYGVRIRSGHAKHKPPETMLVFPYPL